MFKEKRILVLVLAFMFCIIFAGCSENKSTADVTSGDSISTSTTTSTTMSTTTSTTTKVVKSKQTKQSKKKSKTTTTTTTEYTTEYKAEQTTVNQTSANAEVRVQDQNGGCVGNNAALY